MHIGTSILLYRKTFKNVFKNLTKTDTTRLFIPQNQISVCMVQVLYASHRCMTEE